MAAHFLEEQMVTQTFRDSLRPLYPELGGEGPDPDVYADSVIVRVLNVGSDALQGQMVEYYGMERVGAVARARAARLDAPVYRAWRKRLNLPERDATVERIHRLWRR
jgi:hypothetical protein